MSVLISHQRNLIHDILVIEDEVVNLLARQELEVDYLQKIFGDTDYKRPRRLEIPRDSSKNEKNL
jgi:hypothetical protein